MSSSYLLLKENNKQEINTSLNQTLQMEDSNTSSTYPILQMMEGSFSIFLILTLIFLCINVLFKLIEKLLDYLRKKLHKTDTVCDTSKENSTMQSSLKSSKDFQ